VINEVHIRELYDLRTDPGETHNVLQEHLTLATAFGILLRTELLAHPTRQPTGEPQLMSSEEAEALRALGYL
jgi:hypothetical protein